MDVEPETALEQRLGDQEAVGARRRPSRPAARAPPVGRSGCSTGMPSRSAACFAGGAASLRPRPAGRSGRVSSATTSCRAASRSSTSAPNGAVAATTSFMRGGYRSTCAGRRARSRRDSSSVRSSISTPSRWSSSCWTTRASMSSSSSRSGAPVEVLPLERHLDAPARPGRARPGARGSPRRPRPVDVERVGDRRVDDRVALLVPVRWKTNSRCRTPTCVAASPTPRASCISRAIFSASRREVVVEGSTSRARIRSTASGYWRICASARRRRACASASSSSAPPRPRPRARTSALRRHRARV